MYLFYLFLAVLGLFILAEQGLRRLRIEIVYSRKGGHLVLGLAGFVLASLMNAQSIIALAVIGLIMLALINFTELFPAIRKVERHRPGAVYFVIAMGVSAFLFLPEHLIAFQFGTLVLALSDTAAEIFGKLYGKHRIKFLGNKTWQGAGAFFVTTLIIFFAFIYPKHIVSLPYGLLIALILTVAEALLSFGLDNLILPILAAYLVQILSTLR